MKFFHFFSLDKNIIKTLTVFLFLFLSYMEAEESNFGLPPLLSTTDGSPNAIVAGCVSAVDGVYFDTEVDMVIPGPLPIVCSRTYNSHSNRWDFYPGSFIEKMSESGFPVNGRCYYRKLEIHSFDGSHLVFHTRSHRMNAHREEIRSSLQSHQGIGFTNIGKGYIGGKTNLLNNEYDYQNGQLKYGNGIKASYVESVLIPELSFVTKVDFPNLSTFVFNYAPDQNIKKFDHFCRFTVDAKSQSGKPYGQAWFDRGLYIAKKTNSISLHSLKDTRKVTYTLDTKIRSLLRPIIHEVTGEHIPTIKYEYKNGKLIRKFYPKTGRSLEVRYGTSGRVSELLAPVGQNGRLLPIYKFRYGDKYTTVTDANGNEMVYKYDKKSRLVDVQKKTLDANTIFHEKFSWCPSDTHLGCLESYSLVDRQNLPHYVKNYAYDQKHNVICETVSGAISGINEYSEKYVKNYTYSNDNFNNILSESDQRSSIQYQYYPNTDLISSKKLAGKGAILRREFYEYDDTGTLIKEISDDGCTQQEENLSNVSHRFIRKIYPKAEAPCLGMPLQIESYAFDASSSKEILINKTVNRYSDEGLLKEQDIYDSENVRRYTLKKEYDRLGYQTIESDAHGNEIIRVFDENGNKILEQGPRKELQTTFTYDLSSRLTKKISALTTGELFEESFEYDSASNLTKSVNTYGHTTHYRYDALRRCTKKIDPEIYDHHGMKYNPEESFSYDVFGNVSSYTDPNGHTKTTIYNIFKHPILEDFPDGTRIEYQYEMDGVLKKETTKTGAYILYEYDTFKRVLSKKTYSPTNELLTSHSFTYNPFNKLSETDANGNTTYFEYDFAGRLYKQISDQKITITEYDTLSRPHIVKEKVGQDKWKITKKTYDLLNRITEESIEDEQGSILHRVSQVYDKEGNIIEHWNYTESGPSIIYHSYDALNRLIRTETPLREIYTVEYDDNFVNPYGQRVLRKIETDPLLQQTITIHDSHGRPNVFEKKDQNGILLQRSEFFYDPGGNRIRTIETVYFQGISEKTRATAWVYNSVNQITHLIEAEGSPDEKITQYIYNEYGQKEKIIKPDGTELVHGYDSLGRLLSLHSSDQTIDEEYQYDPNGNLIHFIDHAHNTITSRVYDSQNELLEETLGNSLTISYKRDIAGRPTEVTLPDGSTIFYGYDPLYLRSASYNNYTHQYQRYDLNGKLLKQQLIGNAGSVSYVFDPAMRLTNILSDRWKEENIGYDPVGNIIRNSISDSYGTYTSDYTYDNLYQLTSEKGDQQYTYDYDSLQNRRHKNDVLYDLNDLNQLRSQGGISYTYDANGNLISKKEGDKETNYVYDALDRLASVIEDHTKTTFIYDCFHRRIRRIREKIQSDSAPITDDAFVYQGKAEIGLYRSNKFEELRILGAGIRGDIGAAIFIRVQDKTYAPIHDHNGNLSALIDPSWSWIAQSYRYTAFGEEKIFSSWGFSLFEASSPWRFSSKRKEGSLIHFGHRDYDPEIGKWITADPIGYADGPTSTLTCTTIPSHTLILMGSLVSALI